MTRQLGLRSRPILQAVVVAGISVAGTLKASGQPLQCPRPPVESCVTRHGRFSSQNGIPFTIRLIGTTRRVSVANGSEGVPPEARKYLEMTSSEHSYIYGDFEMCPLEADVPGHMREVCVVASKNLVVENVQGLRPPFRLTSTWSATRRAK
jgi:hypothetical protein